MEQMAVVAMSLWILAQMLMLLPVYASVESNDGLNSCRRPDERAPADVVGDNLHCALAEAVREDSSATSSLQLLQHTASAARGRAWPYIASTHGVYKDVAQVNDYAEGRRWNPSIQQNLDAGDLQWAKLLFKEPESKSATTSRITTTSTATTTAANTSATSNSTALPTIVPTIITAANSSKLSTTARRTLKANATVDPKNISKKPTNKTAAPSSSTSAQAKAKGNVTKAKNLSKHSAAQWPTTKVQRELAEKRTKEYEMKAAAAKAAVEASKKVATRPTRTSNSSLRAVGCCYRIGYGAMMKPCCLKTAPRKSSECNTKEKLAGGASGWRSSCPKTAAEAQDWIQVDAQKKDWAAVASALLNSTNDTNDSNITAFLRLTGDDP
eukprot:gnl/TRDRNA2_/TRDRNA2_153856_c0_seq1.p1 gnl/TRDRNA2_/TRDRNA2_153856_c0~~gnl/TRDRNA2_/TRDRNA2_153856_c0_seq1.p1  ORF type:complete len:383 (+),score=67.01 gnl/TRDRNA2_/TRDRNA2_153856_c0_seq1:78-1226(+)